MKKSIFARRILPLFLIILFACTTDYTLKLSKAENTFYSGQYLDAARMLLPQINKKDESQLVFLMEAGLMLHAAGEFEKSNGVLLQASELAKRLATSVRKQAAALLLNENVTNYKGEDFERVLIHMYTGINFLMLDKPEQARIEFKNVNNVLRAIREEGGKKYKQNIMAKYLTSLAFEISGDVDGDLNDTEFAYVELKQINKLEPNLHLAKADLQRLALKMKDREDYSMWKRKFGNMGNFSGDYGEFVLLFHAGKGAIKASRGPIMSDRTFANLIRSAVSNTRNLGAGLTIAGVLTMLKMVENPIPKFKSRSNKVDHLEVEINGANAGRTYELENISDTAVKNMEEEYPKMMGKVAAGVAAKAIAAAAAGLVTKKIAQSNKRTSGIAGLLGAVAGLATGAGLASQIKPDLRCWHTLPAKLHLGRFFLKPGTYAIKIKQVDVRGNVLGTSDFNFGIAKNKKSILNFRTLY